MQTDYLKCYNTLNLDRGADWETAQRSYRRLVHEWHPDRHTATPADSQRAQSYFIELTSSFNAIRKYHRRYRKMPLLTPKNSDSAAPDRQFSTSDSLLNQARKQDQHQRKKRRGGIKRAAIFMLGAGFCMSVFFFLFSLDKQLAAQAGEEARRELKNSIPSRFQRSQDEVNRAEAKGAFIAHDPAGGALGQDSGALFNQQ